MEKTRVTVIGDLPVAGVDKGGTVELDPAETNIDALVEGGHVKLPSAKPGKAEDSGGKAAG